MHELKVGASVTFIDSLRRRLPALVQCVHGNEWVHEGKKHYPCINLVVISPDESKQDCYGRQIEHHTSISYWESQHPTVGYCWTFPDEDVTINESDVATQR